MFKFGDDGDGDTYGNDGNESNDQNNVDSVIFFFQPAREARRLARRAEMSRRDLSALWASWRVSPQAVTSKWHFRTTSPINTNSLAGENGFSAKNGP